jgi:hypothetical protein
LFFYPNACALALAAQKKSVFLFFFAQNEPQNQKKVVSLHRKLKIT